MNETKNNSYETDETPSSSGSGSSLSGENNDDLEMVAVENIKLPLLLEPNYKNEALQNQEYSRSLRQNIITPSSNYRSSQESPFRGFSETPLKLIQQQRFIYPDSTEEDTDREDDGVIFLMQKFPSNSKLNDLPVNKEIYDTIVIENSSNAVDMPLTSQEEDCVEEIAAPQLQAQNSDLSFNGKIKELYINNENAEEKAVLPSNVKINTEMLNELTTIPTIIDLDTTNTFSQSFYKYEASPDLFAVDEDDDDEDNEKDNNIDIKTEINFENEAQEFPQNASFKAEAMDISGNRSFNCPTESSFADEATLDCTNQNEYDFKRLFRENCRRERELLRRTRKCLSGVPPPPSLTIPQLDLIQLVLNRKEDIFNFFKNSKDNNDNKNERTSLLKPTHPLEDIKNIAWRDILAVRQHGLSYNLSTDSENSEYLSLAVVERFVGAETTSSYRRSPSSAKKRNTRLKLLTQSPGNRLSHLAKRRAIFSSANLATTSQKSATALGPQIVIDKKKSKNRRKTTPKRKTPGSKKKARKTPSSSAKKQLFPIVLNKPGPSRETSKRALFQSPLEKQQLPARIIKPQIKPEIATKVEKSKRALFSPESNASETDLPFLSEKTKLMETSLLKRKRFDSQNDIEGLDMPSKKLLRTDASCLTPRGLKIKSQSFCIGAGSSSLQSMTTMTSNMRKQHLTTTSTNSFLSLSSAASSNSSLLSSNYGGSQNCLHETKLQRAHSEYVAPPAASLTDNQKKKLLWAVSQALQEKKISTKHENFKQFASVLARVVRRIFQEFYQRTSTSNSETLLRLAKKYVFYVISGRNADDVYLQVKTQIEETKRSSTSRLTGYIGPEEYQQRKKQQLSQLSQSSILSSSMSLCGSLQNLFSIDNSNAACSEQQQQLLLSSGYGTQNNQQLQIDSNAKQTNFSKYWPSSTVVSEAINKTTKHQQRSIEVNSNLQNSSSKSNLGSLALRENSGQKNFTGKDQRNVSPYAKSNSGLKLSTITLSSTETTMHANNGAKVKRQIFFDS